MTEFTLHTDPENPKRTWVTVDEWTPTMTMVPGFIGVQEHAMSVEIEGVVRFKVANGSAVYRITGWDAGRRALALELIEHTGPTG
jgi:hypothetical protein